MTVEIAPGPVAPPGGVQPSDKILVVRPGAPAGLYGVAGTNLLSAANLTAVLASLPTTSQPSGVPWINGGFLCFGPATGGGGGGGGGGGSGPTNHVLLRDGVSRVLLRDGTFLTFR